MATRSLGTLTVDLVTKLGGFTKGMDAAARETANFEKKINSTFSKIGESFNRLAGLFGAGLGFEALRRTAGAAIEYGDEISKAAAKTGVGVEAFSELAYAAKQTDIEMASLSTAFKKMQVTLSEAGSGSKSATDALAALGLTVKELKALAPDKQFELLADRIAALKDPADRARAAVDFFGKAGADLLPLFQDGARGVRELREEAHRLGATLTEEQVQALADTDSAVKRLKATYSGLARTLTAEVAPGLSMVFDNLNAFLSGDATGKAISKLRYEIEFLQQMQGRSFVSVGYGDIGTGFFTAAEGAEKLLELQKKLAAYDRTSSGRRTAGGPGQAPTAAPPGYLPDKPKAGRTAVNREIETAQKTVTSFIEKLSEQQATLRLTDKELLQYEITTGDVGKALDTLGTKAGPLREKLANLIDTTSAEQARVAIEQQVTALNDQATAAGLTDQQAFALSVTQGELSKQIALAGGDTDALTRSLLEARQALEDMNAEVAKQSERADIFEATRTDAEKYASTLEHLQELFKGTSDQETYGRAVGDTAIQYITAGSAAEEYRLRVEELQAQLSQGLLTQTGYEAALARVEETFAEAGRKAGEAFLDQAKRNTQDIVASFLEDPFSHGIKGLEQDFADMFRRIAAQAVAADLANALFNGFDAWISKAQSALSSLTSGSGSGGWLSAAGSFLSALFGGGSASSTSGLDPSLASILGLSEGGYTGDGAKLQPAGVVHKGEWVTPADKVRIPGVRQFLSQIHSTPLNSLRALEARLPRFASGGLVGSATPSPSSITRAMAAAPQGGGSVINQNFEISAPQGTVSKATQQQIAAAAARGLAAANRRNN
jgi:hypothetical protein